MKTKRFFAAMMAAFVVTVGSASTAFAGDAIIRDLTPAEQATFSAALNACMNAPSGAEVGHISAVNTGVDMYPEITVYNSSEALAQAAAVKDYGKVFDIHKAALRKYYMEQPALTVPFKESSAGNAFYYNAAQGAVGKSEINIFTNVDGGAFMKCYISGDWSDHAQNIYNTLAANPTADEETKQSFLEAVPYYENIPNVVYVTLVEILGQNEGTNFFCFFKSNADVFDGSNTSLGIAAQNLPLGIWSLRTTDYGIPYSIDHYYGGFEITLYY